MTSSFHQTGDPSPSVEESQAARERRQWLLAELDLVLAEMDAERIPGVSAEELETALDEALREVRYGTS